jgi:Fe-S-cluster containining protein
MPPEYDCQRCGLCCVADYDYGYYVDLTDDDLARLSPYYRRTHVVGEDTKNFPALATLTRDDGAVLCVAFRGREMVSCRCTIYDTRPQICRNFKPGSKTCQDIRRPFLPRAALLPRKTRR